MTRSSPPATARSRATGQDAVVRTLPQWGRLVAASFVPVHLVPVRLDPIAPGGFTGRLRSRMSGELTVADITASGHEVDHPTTPSVAPDESHLKLSFQLRGQGLLTQNGRNAVLRPGDFALFETRRPYTLVYERSFRTLVLMFPRSAVAFAPDVVDQMSAVTLSGQTGFGRVVGSFMTELSEQLDLLSATAGQRLAHNLLDLVSTMLAAELGTSYQRTFSARRELYEQITVFILENLHDPELSPTSIAAAHYISTRHLHNVFRAAGTTVSATIRRERLHRCRRDLSDPLTTGSVTAIANRWGFVDSAHFSRCYRNAFGESPTDTRRGSRT